jgi:hypothetical protein
VSCLVILHPFQSTSVINLLSGGGFTYAVKNNLDRAFFGLLTSPRRGGSPQLAIDLNLPWACDNDCFINYDRDAICKMLKKYQRLPGCVFINAPDVVRNHRYTLRRFKVWEQIIHGLGFPVAFTVQNGCTVDLVPWGECEAIFIGGDNQYKYSLAVREIVAEANRLGMWIHNGRVNTPYRIRYSRAIGCTSFDGTSYSINHSIIHKMWKFHTGEVDPVVYQMGFLPDT